MIRKKLSNPDELIIAAKATLFKQERKDYSTGIISTNRDEISIRVTAPLITRALLFMDSLIKILKSQGYSIYIKNEETFISIDNIEIKIGLREKTKRVPPKDKWMNHDLEPTGKLCFKIEYIVFRKEWEDKVTLIEDHFDDIIIKIKSHVEDRKIQNLKIEKWHEEYKANLKLEEEEVQKKQKETDELNNLLDDARRWQEAITLRNYIDEIEKIALRERKLTPQLEEWLAWARSKADSLDSLSNFFKQ